jgi:hypothetical protein
VTQSTRIFLAVAILSLGLAFAAIAADDACLTKLHGEWELQADSIETEQLLKVFGKMIFTFDMKKLELGAKVGDKVNTGKPFTVVSCAEKEVKIRATSKSGAEKVLKITFTDDDNMKMTSDDQGDNGKVQVFKRAKK